MKTRQDKLEAIRAACLARGIEIDQREGFCVLSGPGVDMKVADLAQIDVRDLQAHPYAEDRQ